MVDEVETKKMERSDVEENGNPTGQEAPSDSNEPEKVVAESKACPDLHKDLTDLTSQVQMMSDSLAACKQMSKYRPLRKAYDVVVKTTDKPRTSNQLLPPAEKKKSLEEDTIVSFVTKSSKNPKVDGWNLDQDFPNETELNTWPEGRRRKRDFGWKVEDFRELQKKRRKTQVTKMEDSDPEILAELIRRELSALVYLAPTVSVLAAVLSDAVFKYSEHAKRSKRLSSSLPWILNRVQELIRYIVIKRQPLHESDLSEPTIKQIITRAKEKKEEDDTHAKKKKEEVEQETHPKNKEETEEEDTHEKNKEQVGKKERNYRRQKKKKKRKKRDHEPILAPEEPEFGILEKVDPNTWNSPGVQIHLELKSGIQKTRFFEKADRTVLPADQENHCTVLLNEPTAIPVVHAFNPKHHPEVLLSPKQEVIHPKQHSLPVWLTFIFSTRTSASFLVFTPTTRKTQILTFRETVDLKAVAPYEEQTLQWKRNSVTFLKTVQPARVVQEIQGKNPRPKEPPKEPPKTPNVQVKKTPPKETKIRCLTGERKPRSNERKLFNFKNFLSNAPNGVKELLVEAEAEKMELKKLEAETAGLKTLMAEVHKNQIELSKFLLEKGIYSQPLIKMTNPKMLEDESEAVRKLEESFTGSELVSAESIQEQLSDLKERCCLKKKMILCLIRGLKSNIPQEWWEDIMSSNLDEKSPDDIDCEKLEELIEKCWCLQKDVENASRKKSEAEEEPSEEEPNTNSKSEESVQEGASENLTRPSESKTESQTESLTRQTESVAESATESSLTECESKVLKASRSKSLMGSSKSKSLKGSKSKCRTDSDSKSLKGSKSKSLMDGLSKSLMDSNFKSLTDSESKSLRGSKSKSLKESRSKSLTDSKCKSLSSSKSKSLMSSQSKSLTDNASESKTEAEEESKTDCRPTDDEEEAFPLGEAPWKVWAFPAFHIQEDLNASIANLENQISLLNAQNEKLWQEVHELRHLLAGSMREFNERRPSCSSSNGRLSSSPGKTIKLTIQIGGEKVSRSPRHSDLWKINEIEETYSQESFADAMDTSSSLSYTRSNVSSASDTTPVQERTNLTVLESVLKSDRRLPKNDLYDVDDASPPDRHLPKNGVFDQKVTQQVHRKLPTTPYPSGHGISTAGPSIKHIEHIREKPSMMQLAEDKSPDGQAMIANERLLQPILEDGNLESSCRAEAVSQIIQRLRIRLRAIQKEVTVLRLKNDRIEKLLDKLLEDAVDSSRSLEEMENTLHDRLG